MDPALEAPILALVWYGVFIISLTLHEAGHAFAAKLLGDPTAYLGGQVTLNPRPHIEREPIGTVLVPVISYTLPLLMGAQHGWMMGWASAPYNPHWAARFPRRAAWMAAAGPAANLLLAIIALLLIRLGMAAGFLASPQSISDFAEVAVGADGDPSVLSQFLSVLYMLNLILMLFNLIPLPPLDGSAIVQLFMREETSQRWQDFMRQPGFALVGLLIAWKLFSYISPGAVSVVTSFRGSLVDGWLGIGGLWAVGRLLMR